MALGWAGVLKGIKRRVRQGQDHELTLRYWPVRVPSGALSGNDGGPETTP